MFRNFSEHTQQYDGGWSQRYLQRPLMNIWFNERNIDHSFIPKNDMHLLLWCGDPMYGMFICPTQPSLKHVHEMCPSCHILSEEFFQFWVKSKYCLGDFSMVFISFSLFHVFHNLCTLEQTTCGLKTCCTHQID